MLFEVPGWKIGKPTVSQPKKAKKKDESEPKAAPQKESPQKKKQKVEKKPRNEPPVTQQPSIQKKPTKDLEQLTRLSGMASKAERKLSGARFRHLNEKLYQSSSQDALKYFSENPDDFVHYHHGFREQTKAWPVNPVDIFIEKLTNTIAKTKANKLVVVDMGCGEAKIAATFADRHAQVTVRSFDLVSINEHIEIASMTAVPMEPSTADIVIFSLSLMNTDFVAALKEAHRILKPSGQLWIAEVESRFPEKQDGVDEFADALLSVGFRVSEKILNKKVFIILYATKVAPKAGDKGPKPALPILKPCLYKKR